MALPLESGLAICVLAKALAEKAGLPDDEIERVHFVAQLRHVGCTAENQTFGAFVEDEIKFRGGAAGIEATSPKVMFAYTMRHLVRENGLLGAAGKFVQMAGAKDRLQEAVLAVCEVAVMVADRLGLDDGIKNALLMGPERWDGKSHLKRASAEEVPAATRVVQIAECAVVYKALGGTEAAAKVVRERANGAFDPRLAATFADNAAELCAATEQDSLWSAVTDTAPAEEEPLGAGTLDIALGSIAEFADLKSPSTVGHSTGVAALAQTAAEHAGLSTSDADALRQSALVHDIGRVGVPSSVWEKTTPLNAGDWERIRLHPYLGERILARSPGLNTLAAIATLHHERCDGSGYHRGVDARSLPQTAKLLAAADAFHAMTEPRPHRPAMTTDQAAEELRGEARAGRLDGDAVACVLAAAGHAPRKRQERPAGLTARECDVLRLVARGLSTKQIAAGLVISPKTADSHIQHIYTKLGVSTRAAATVFAMRQDIV